MRKFIILLAALAALVAFTVPAFAFGRQSPPPRETQPPNFSSFFKFGHPFTHGATLASLTATNDCTLTVPKHPRSAAGLATPYVLSSGNDGTTCTEENPTTAAFVEAVIYVPSTGQLNTYTPVVEDAGQQTTPPPVPTLPHGAVVAIWTGFNDNVLKLIGPGAHQFVNFAQQGYDNSPQWFNDVYSAVQRGQVNVPALGTSPMDGKSCPSIRSWDVVDQDQSDNVPVTYPAYGVSNGSDDQLIDYIDQSLGCTPWMVPSLSSPGTMTPAGPLDEVQAAFYDAQPQALVPGGDEFVTNNGNFLPPLGDGQPDLYFQNLYRAQVGQPFTFNDNDTKAYCENLFSIGAPKLAGDAQFEQVAEPGFAGTGLTLAQFLAARFSATWTNLNCTALTGDTQPNS
jgi:hypothetical protein